MPDTHDERGGDESAPWRGIRLTPAGRLFVGLDDPTEELREQLAAATEQAGLAEAQATEIQAERNEWQRRAQRGHAVAEILRAELAAATARAEKAEALVAEFGDEWGVQAEDSERAQPCDDEDQARHLADRYSRFRLPGGERIRYRVARRLATEWRDAEPANATPDGHSQPVERSETSGGHGEGSNSSATAAGLSERCPCGCPKIGDGCNCRYCNEPYPTQQPNNDTTEDGQHG